MMYLRTICIILIAVNSLKSQTARQDMVQLNLAYNKYTKMSYSSTYMMYNSSNSKLLETYSFTYKKNGDNFFSKSKDEEFLVNKDYMVIIDHEDKEVHLAKSTNRNEAAIQKIINDRANLPLYMDTLMSVYKSVNAIKTSAPDCRAYRFELYQGLYSSVDIVIDVKKWLIREIFLYPTETTEVNGKETNVILKVVFDNYVLEPVYTNDFSEAKYLEKRNGKFILKPIYASYKLYDQTL